jgi:hypothetical protein
VLPKKQVDQLVASYQLRSKTAHEGKLFGDETLTGAFPLPGYFSRPDGRHAFRWEEVRQLRQASRNLLIQAIEPQGQPVTNAVPST